MSGFTSPTLLSRLTFGLFDKPTASDLVKPAVDPAVDVAAPPHLTVLEIFDRMLEALATEDRWMKVFLYRDTASLMSLTAGPHCLNGVANLIDHGYATYLSDGGKIHYSRPETAIVMTAIQQAIDRNSGRFVLNTAEFNNLQSVRHADLLEIINEARAGFIGSQETTT